jgi:hypothetical protein
MPVDVSTVLQLKLAAIRSSAAGTDSKNKDVSTAMSKFIPTWRATNAQTANDLEIAIRDAVQT